MTDFEAGVFLVDKPAGPSSFAMIRKVRKLLEMKKVGHAGTLDPFASGLLIVCAGRPATRLISSLMEGDKEYIATLRLGAETTTQDPEGEIITSTPVGCLLRDDVESVLSTFVGEQLQTPPVYSALKHQGKPLYYYARRGIAIEKPPRNISIRTLEWLDNRDTVEGAAAEIRLRVVCSKGTYIRTLGADIGRALGVGAYLSQLRRTRSGKFTVDTSFSGTDFSADDALQRFLECGLSVESAVKLLQ